MAHGFGRSWWGKAWLQALSHIDHSNRLPRGASYARYDHVKSIKINGGEIVARVSGSRPQPYSETMHMNCFPQSSVKRFMDEVCLHPAIISKMLNRELDPELMKIAEKMGLNFFPESWRDLHMYCSCPDWAVPCKHLAAVIYIVSQEIDNNPFMLFELHGVDLIAELNKRNIHLDAKEVIAVPELDDAITTKQSSAPAANAFHRIDFTTITDISSPLFSILPDDPPFYGNGNFKSFYKREILRAMKFAGQIISGSKTLEEVYKRTCVTHIDTHETIVINMNEDLEFKECDLEELSMNLMNIQPSLLEDYQPSVRALQQSLYGALYLLANGAVVPQIFHISDDNYVVCWIPAYMDQNVREIVRQLDELFTEDVFFLNKGKKRMPIDHPAEMAISAFLLCLIPRSATKLTYWDKCYEIIFGGYDRKFDELGEKETPGGIKAWLDHLCISTHRFLPVLIVNADEDKTDRFTLSVSIEDTEKREREAIPLCDIMHKKAFEEERFGILKELAMLGTITPGLEDYINHNGEEDVLFDLQEFTPFLLDVIPAMRLIGIKVMLPNSLKEILHPRPTVSITKKQSDGTRFIRIDDLLDFEWKIAVGDAIVDEDYFDTLLEHADSLLFYKGHYIYVSEADIKKLEKMRTASRQMTPARLMQIALAKEFDHAPIKLTDEARALIKQLTDQQEIPIPQEIRAVLRPYQERGYSWMYRNMRLGFGSIIADDMGLGKTIQVITLLQKLKDEEALQKKKVLTIVPTGLLTNWEAELHRFAPALTTFIYHGSNRSLDRFDADILLTSYGIVRSDVTLLKKMKWMVVVIDEAQNIKNSDTAQSKAVKSISAEMHVAMSGTPVENRLSEYWSIMDFCNKGYLGTLKKFIDDYAKPIQATGDRQLAERFRKITAPLMLRRLKTDKKIISDLPDKIEQDEMATLSSPQAALYKSTVNKALNVIQEAGEGDLFKRDGLVLQMIMALKQICNHPAQFLKNGDTDPALSGKAEMLLDLVDSINDAGEKAIIFTQFKEMGDLLADFIAKRTGEKPMFLHGGTNIKKRQEMIDRFQNNHGDRIFILSLKAAGTGLNLTAASHVIHYDLWWNPAVEAQATDRAYRIGQTKNVMVHRLITKNTFEERINEMIQKKKELADLTVAAGENWIGKLSNRELRDIFG